MYKEAFAAYDALLKTHLGAEADIFHLGSDDQKPQRRAVAIAFIRDSNNLLALVAKASSMPRCYFPHDWSTASTATPEYAKIRHICVLSESRAKLQAKSGDVAGAYRTLVDCSRIARQFSSVPALMANLSSVTYANVALTAAADILMAHPGDQVAISGAQSVLDATGDPPGIRAGIVAEAPTALIIIRSIRSPSDFVSAIASKEGPRRFAADVDALISKPAFRRTIEAKYLESIVRMVSKFPADEENWKGFKTAIESAVQAADRDGSLTGKAADIFLPMSLWPNLVAAARSRQHLLATAIKLLSLRAQGKPLPDDLPDFGKISVDPMDGAKLRYKRIGTGFKIWGIGRDGVDHGGSMRPRKPVAGAKYDEVLEFR